MRDAHVGVSNDTGSRRRTRPSLAQAILSDRIGRIGAVLAGLAAATAIFGPLFAPYDPTLIHADARLAPPSARFILGADELGRDILSRAVNGARVSLQVSMAVVVISGSIGVTIGMLAGFVRGRVDTVLMRLMDTIFAFPTLLLALAIVAVLGTALVNVVIALTIVYVPAFARIARGSTLTVMQEPYIEAARSVGAPDIRLLLRHVLPNITAPITVQATIAMAYSILAEASLSYLGLGVQPPAASWGSMLATGKPYLELSPWVSVVPGMAIMLTVLGFNLLGDAMRDALDPRMGSREAVRPAT